MLPWCGMRAAIQSHMTDLLLLPNGVILDPWALRERHRVYKRNARRSGANIAVAEFVSRLAGEKKRV